MSTRAPGIRWPPAERALPLTISLLTWRTRRATRCLRQGTHGLSRFGVLVASRRPVRARLGRGAPGSLRSAQIRAVGSGAGFGGAIGRPPTSRRCAGGWTAVLASRLGEGPRPTRARSLVGRPLLRVAVAVRWAGRLWRASRARVAVLASRPPGLPSSFLVPDRRPRTTGLVRRLPEATLGKPSQDDVRVLSTKLLHGGQQIGLFPRTKSGRKVVDQNRPIGVPRRHGLSLAHGTAEMTTSAPYRRASACRGITLTNARVASAFR